MKVNSASSPAVMGDSPATTWTWGGSSSRMVIVMLLAEPTA